MHWYPRYMSAGARRARAMPEMRQLRDRGVRVQPIETRQQTIARGFWGRRWCERLDSFAGREDHLPQGRVLVRNGSVCHLEIRPGIIEAMVAGSALFHVVVRVPRMEPAAWTGIGKACAGRIASVPELLEGTLPEPVVEAVTDPDRGLLPRPGEIQPDCACAGRGTVCRHAAAALYGVGYRLDAAPELLFRLRGVDAAELVGGAPAPVPGPEAVAYGSDSRPAAPPRSLHRSNVQTPTPAAVAAGSDSRPAAPPRSLHRSNVQTPTPAAVAAGSDSRPAAPPRSLHRSNVQTPTPAAVAAGSDSRPTSPAGSLHRSTAQAPGAREQAGSGAEQARSTPAPDAPPARGRTLRTTPATDAPPARGKTLRSTPTTDMPPAGGRTLRAAAPPDAPPAGGRTLRTTPATDAPPARGKTLRSTPTTDMPPAGGRTLRAAAPPDAPPAGGRTLRTTPATDAPPARGKTLRSAPTTDVPPVGGRTLRTTPATDAPPAGGGTHRAAPAPDTPPAGGRTLRAAPDTDPGDSIPARPAPEAAAPEATAPEAAAPDPAGNGDASGFHPTGTFIRQLRHGSGFSVAEFAALLRVSTATVRRWEAVPGSLTLRSGPREALRTLRDAIAGDDT